MDEGLVAQVIDFIQEIYAGLDSGYLFFGGPADVVRYIFDILLIAFVLYHLLKLLRQTRAWQLMQGLFLIVLFTMLCSLLGLEMVGFLFNNILYIVAIAFVVIFQPELRRALETIGLKSFSTFSNALSPEYQESQNNLSKLIDQLVDACTDMAKSYTGALIIIERNSKLGELLEQENVVLLDSSVTNSMLQSIFFKGSPLHDGAVLIRDARIAAARCHIPLSESVHNMENSGTRHRAAVGASEMGDAVAIAVSEERGKISLAIDGCLYLMRNGDELKNNLIYLFGITHSSGRFVRRSRTVKSKVKSKASNAGSTASGQKEVSVKEKGVAHVEGENIAVACSADSKKKNAGRSKENELPVAANKSNRSGRKMSVMRKIAYIILSLVISLGLWMYIQINNNPVIEKEVTLDLLYDSADYLGDNNLATSFEVEQVTVTIVGRKNVLDNLSDPDLRASIDYSLITGPGVYTLPVSISSEKNVYYRIELQVPESITVVIFTNQN